MFTVRSASHLEKERQASRMREGSSRFGCNHLWKAVWNLQVLNASKVIMLEACSNILSTKENLLKRGVVKEDLCIFCTKEKGAALHILWECPSSMDI